MSYRSLVHGSLTSETHTYIMRIELIGSSNLNNKIKGNASRQLALGNSPSYCFRTHTVALHCMAG